MNIFTMNGKAGTDLTGKAGYAVVLDGSEVVVCTAATDLPIGVISSVIDMGAGVGNQLGVALPGAIVPVKVADSVKRLQRGYLQADGTAKAATGGAGEVEFCQFIQDGDADEEVMALILAPIKRA